VKEILVMGFTTVLASFATKVIARILLIVALVDCLLSNAVKVLTVPQIPNANQTRALAIYVV